MAALKARGVKLGSPKNLTNEARARGTESIIKKRVENENWKMAKLFIEHFQLKYGFSSLTILSKELKINGYKTRNSCEYTPTIVKRLLQK